LARGSLRLAGMRIDARAPSSRRLLLGTLFLPLFLAGCLGGEGPGESVGQRNDRVEDANDQTAFDYFVGQGLTDVQAAGIVGNLDQESGMSPTIAQEGGGPGRGIAQWSVGGRWDTSSKDNVAWYASQQGASEYALSLQLDFIWYELTTFGYGYSELRAATTVTEAVTAFQDDYEICGTCDSSNRVAYAEAALADFGGGATPPPTGGSCTVAGVEGTCILTTTCAAKSGYTSTAGHCPGAADIECCTPVSSSSGSSSSSTSSGSSSTSSSSSSSSGGSSSSSSSSSSGGGSSSSSSSSSGSPAPACSVDGVEGTCIQTSACATEAGYTSTAGLCPGPASEECCTPPPSCKVNGVVGACMLTSTCADMGGTSTPGFCPGAADIECCTE
jgi:Phage tail lysozyme